jgi:hypothetical protein
VAQPVSNESLAPNDVERLGQKVAPQAPCLQPVRLDHPGRPEDAGAVSCLLGRLQGDGSEARRVACRLT